MLMMMIIDDDDVVVVVVVVDDDDDAIDVDDAVDNVKSIKLTLLMMPNCHYDGDNITDNIMFNCSSITRVRVIIFLRMKSTNKRC
jgi:hypothetical protein